MGNRTRSAAGLAVGAALMREAPRAGTVLAGYRLEEPLARGGMAVVYVAEHLRLGRKVALKILAPELAEDESFRERFLRESRVAAGIDHPNVIPVHDAGEADGLLYIAMRYVEGSDLWRLLRDTSPLEIARSISIATQIAAGLGAAHERDLVHRDIKPANVLLIPRRTPADADHIYLADFGLAKHASSISRLTKTGQFMGTVSYIAPEQAAGKGVDARTDIYALGCVLFECLAGRPPFRKEDEVAVIMAHLNEPPPLLTELRPDCPPALAELVDQTLAKSPDDRPQSCDELIAALRATKGARSESRSAATASHPAATGVDSGAESRAAWRRLSRPRWWIAGFGGAAAAALAVALLVGGDEGGESRAPATNGPAPITRLASAPRTAAEWRELDGARTPRQQAPSAVSGERLWVFGGLSGNSVASIQATPAVESYDPAVDSWTPGPDLPLRLHHSMAGSYGGEHVVIGGWVPKGAELTSQTSDRVFALRGDRWVELPSLNQPRSAGAAAVVGDEIVVVGGQGEDGELLETTEVFDGKRWHEAAPLPTPREHLAAASEGEFVYAVGGRNLTADKNTRALERYDPRANRWTRLPSMPTPRGSLGAAIIEGNLVAVGGEEPTRVLDAVEAFDLKTKRWSVLAPLRTPRHGLSVVAIGRTLYVLGGALAPTHVQSTSTAEALDFR